MNNIHKLLALILLFCMDYSYLIASGVSYLGMEMPEDYKGHYQQRERECLEKYDSYELYFGPPKLISESEHTQNKDFFRTLMQEYHSKHRQDSREQALEKGQKLYFFMRMLDTKTYSRKYMPSLSKAWQEVEERMQRTNNWLTQNLLNLSRNDRGVLSNFFDYVNEIKNDHSQRAKYFLLTFDLGEPIGARSKLSYFDNGLPNIEKVKNYLEEKHKELNPYSFLPVLWDLHIVYNR